MTTRKRELTPHQKIIKAFNEGVGIRLSAVDVMKLGLDDAITTAAAAADARDKGECPECGRNLKDTTTPRCRDC